jgi:hypothetical protein
VIVRHPQHAAGDDGVATDASALLEHQHLEPGKRRDERGVEARAAADDDDVDLAVPFVGGVGTRGPGKGGPGDGRCGRSLNERTA